MRLLTNTLNGADHQKRLLTNTLDGADHQKRLLTNTLDDADHQKRLLTNTLDGADHQKRLLTNTLDGADHEKRLLANPLKRPLSNFPGGADHLKRLPQNGPLSGAAQVRSASVGAGRTPVWPQPARDGRDHLGRLLVTLSDERRVKLLVPEVSSPRCWQAACAVWNLRSSTWRQTTKTARPRR